MNQNKIVPNIWFNTDNGNISEVVEYYKNIFGEDLQSGSVIALGETPGWNTELCEIRIYGQPYMLMATGKEHHPFNDAVSFMINCEDQNEIDKFWDYFTKEGKEYNCGWCMDKYGLRWQVLPKNLAELMSRPNAMEVMMNQVKIVIDEYSK